ncbi:hypothetical protein QR680_011650 [Steinernema hermaphroditum]|uniref:Uncharacterized protein n=1 Tax=Steinernema hermaphroditum TaxID=289476 RepID=A0AA39I108_9BILA|nr:hypothetical protein QR680_011650 [Steinernema hermaphroditum]
MENLTIDQIDHLVQFLSLKDIEALSKITAGQPLLANWSAVAEEHLRGRFHLQLDVYLPPSGDTELENHQKQMHLSVKKVTGDHEEPWNFTRNRYAYIANVVVHSYPEDLCESHRPTRIAEVIRIVSLPVVPRDDMKSTFVVQELEAPEMNVALDLVEAAQGCYTELDIQSTSNGSVRKAEEVISGYINREAFLESLYVLCENMEQEELLNAVVGLVLVPRRQRLLMDLPTLSMHGDEIEFVIDYWRNTDGVFGEVLLFCRELSPIERIYLESYNPVLGYIAHPRRRSSIRLLNDGFSIVKFERRHEPVDFNWIHSLIESWKAGLGGYIYRNYVNIKVKLNNRRDWDQLVAEFGPILRDAGRPKLRITHPSTVAELRVKKCSQGQVSLMSQNYLDEHIRLLELCNHWRAGSGDFFVGSVARIQVHLHMVDYEDLVSAPDFYSHPNGSRRLKVSMRRFAMDDWVQVRLEIVGVDDGAVESWNLAQLFECFDI